MGWVYNDYGTYWTFGISFIWLGISVILLIVSYKRLVPYQKISDDEITSDTVEIEVTKL